MPEDLCLNIWTFKPVKQKNASKQAKDTRRITSAHVDSNIRVNNECEKSQNHNTIKVTTEASKTGPWIA